MYVLLMGTSGGSLCGTPMWWKGEGPSLGTGDHSCSKVQVIPRVSLRIHQEAIVAGDRNPSQTSSGPGGFIALDHQNSRSYTSIRHGWIKGTLPPPFLLPAFSPVPALTGRLPLTRRRSPHLHHTPRPYSVQNSLFLSDGPARGKFSASSPGWVCSAVCAP